MGVGVNSKSGNLGRKTKIFWESKDFSRNWDTFSGRQQVINLEIQDV